MSERLRPDYGSVMFRIGERTASSSQRDNTKNRYKSRSGMRTGYVEPEKSVMYCRNDLFSLVRALNTRAFTAGSEADMIFPIST